MADPQDFSDMPLTAALAAWLKEAEWNDEIEIGDDRKSSRVVTSMRINDQGHKLFFECDEYSEQFFLYLYSPYNIPPTRIADAVRILNIINIKHHKRGRLACYDDDDANPIQFLWVIDVEGSSLTPTQIENMLNSGIGLFEFFGDALGQIALTKRPVMKIWEEFLAEKQAQSEAKEEDDVPSEL